MLTHAGPDFWMAEDTCRPSLDVPLMFLQPSPSWVTQSILYRPLWLPVLSLSSSHLSPNLPPIASIARPPPPQRLLRALPNPSVLLSVIPDPHDHSCRTNPHPRTSGDRRRCALGMHAIRFPTRNTLTAPLGAHLLLSSHHAQTPDTPLRAPRPANVIPPSSRSCQD